VARRCDDTVDKKSAVCVPLRIYGKGTGIVIPITETKLWEREENRESSYAKKFAGVSQQFFFENR